MDLCGRCIDRNTPRYLALIKLAQEIDIRLFEMLRISKNMKV